MRKEKVLGFILPNVLVIIILFSITMVYWSEVEGISLVSGTIYFNYELKSDQKK